MTPVSNFQDSPDGCKHSLAFFSRQHRLGLSHQGKVRCWVFSADASAPCVPVHRYAQIWPQIFTNLWCAQHNALDCSSFPSRSNHRFRLYPHTLPNRADHTQRADSFVHSVWNGSTVQTNLQPPPADSQVAAYNLHKTNPATNTLRCRLV